MKRNRYCGALKLPPALSARGVGAYATIIQGLTNWTNTFLVGFVACLSGSKAESMLTLKVSGRPKGVRSVRGILPRCVLSSLITLNFNQSRSVAFMSLIYLLECNSLVQIKVNTRLMAVDNSSRCALYLTTCMCVHDELLSVKDSAVLMKSIHACMYSL